MIADRISSEVEKGLTIPKPNAKQPFKVKGWGTRRGEIALIYYIPSHTNPSKPYEKGVTITEFEQAYQQLINEGQIERKWFNENMIACSKEGGCNFTTIGGIFELLGIATYEYGKYIKK
jgi:hypothetical protein